MSAKKSAPTKTTDQPPISANIINCLRQTRSSSTVITSEADNAIRHNGYPTDSGIQQATNIVTNEMADGANTSRLFRKLRRPKRNEAFSSCGKIPHSFHFPHQGLFRIYETVPVPSPVNWYATPGPATAESQGLFANV